MVVIVLDVFEAAARLQAEAHGMPDLAIYAYPGPTPGFLDPAIEETKAVESLDKLIQMLVRGQG